MKCCVCDKKFRGVHIEVKAIDNIDKKASVLDSFSLCIDCWYRMSVDYLKPSRKHTKILTFKR